jgi:hypothetical protein
MDFLPSAVSGKVKAQTGVSASEPSTYAVIAYDENGKRYGWPTDKNGVIKPLDRIPTQEEVQIFADEIANVQI